MKKTIIITLCLAMLLSTVLCACSGGNSTDSSSATDVKKEILSALYDAQSKAKGRTSLIIDYWNVDDEFYVKDVEKLAPFDIAKIADKLKLEESKVRSFLQENYTLNGEYEIDSNYRCVNLFRNSVYSDIYKGSEALRTLEAQALFYDLDTTEIKKMQDFYTTTLYNFFMVKKLFDVTNAKSEYASELDALKTKVDNAYNSGALSEDLHRKYTSAISDLKALDALSYTILDFCMNVDNSTEVYSSKETYEASVKSAISAVDDDVRQIENLN